MGLLGTIGKTAKKQIDELVKLGYPESTAKKIASGELPMDYASRMDRARLQGYDVDKLWFHGSSNVAGETIPYNLKLGDMPLYNKEVPIDYGLPYGRKPTAKDYAKQSAQESLLINEWKLKDAYNKAGDEGVINAAKDILDEDIAGYKDDWAEIVPDLEKIRDSITKDNSTISFKGGYKEQGIEAFDPEAAVDGLYGKGVYMTDSNIIAGGGEGNHIADLGYATPRNGEGAPTVYPLTHKIQNAWDADKGKIRRKDMPIELRKEFEDMLLSQGKNPKGKYPISDSEMRSYTGNDWTNNLLQEIGYDGITHKGGQIMGTPAHRVSIAFDPSQIRSVNAAFDPDMISSPNLLAMRPEALAGLMSVIGSSEQPENLYGADQAIPPTQRQVVNQQMNALGIDPVEQAGYEYGSLIPARKNKETGEVEPAIPAVGRDIIRGLLDLMEGTQSGYFDPRSAIDVMM